MMSTHPPGSLKLLIVNALVVSWHVQPTVKFGDLANFTEDPKLKFSGGRNVIAVVATPETPN